MPFSAIVTVYQSQFTLRIAVQTFLRKPMCASLRSNERCPSSDKTLYCKCSLNKVEMMLTCWHSSFSVNINIGQLIVKWGPVSALEMFRKACTGANRNTGWNRWEMSDKLIVGLSSGVFKTEWSMLSALYPAFWGTVWLTFALWKKCIVLLREIRDYFLYRLVRFVRY